MTAWIDVVSRTLDEIGGGPPPVVSIMRGLNTSQGGRTRAVLSRSSVLARQHPTIIVVISPQPQFDDELREARSTGLVSRDVKFIPFIPSLLATIRCDDQGTSWCSSPEVLAVLDDVHDDWESVQFQASEVLPPEIVGRLFARGSVEIRRRAPHWDDLRWVQLRNRSQRTIVDFFVDLRTSHFVRSVRPLGSPWYENPRLEVGVWSRRGGFRNLGSLGSAFRTLMAEFERRCVLTVISDVLEHDTFALPSSDRRAVLAQLHGRSFGRVLNGRLLDAFVFLTAEQHGDAIRKVSTRRSASWIIPHPTPEGASLPASPPVRDRGRVVVLGRLVKEKRVDHVIRAFARVLQRTRDRAYHLEILGIGPDLARLQDLATELGIGDHVNFGGFEHRPMDALASAGVSVLASEKEGAGLVLLESLAVGTPVVAYDIKYGPREFVEDGVNGFLVPSGDVDALAARLDALLDLPDERYRSMVGEARRAADRYDMSRYEARWNDLLGSVRRRSGPVSRT